MSLRIVTYDEIDQTEWGRLVRESETGTWFQSPEAFDFLSSMPELFSSFCIAVEKSELKVESGKLKELRAVCVGYVTKERSRLKQFFTRRAIVNGVVCIANNATNEEVEILLSAIRKQLNSKTIYIETRNFNDYGKWREAFEVAGFSYSKHLNFHVDCRDKKAMWERLSDNRKRQIKKSAAISELAKSELEVREWYEILERLYRKKVKTPLWPVEFFLGAYRQGIGKFLLVKYEGKVIGGSMVVVKKAYPQPLPEGKGECFASVWGAHTADSTQYDLLKANAQANRNNPTEAEAILWDMLKSNNIGLHFRRQHIILNYIVDFICIKKGLVIELDGGYHTNPEQKEYDEQRTIQLQKLGYTELRFTNEEIFVKPEEVIAKIKAIAEKLPLLRASSQPLPERKGESLGTVYEWFECGMNAEYKEQYPSVMATWAGMQFAHELGCARYDMMGAGVPGVSYGVRDFKSEFGGTMVEHGRFLCVCKPWLYKIGQFGVKVLKRFK